MLLQLLFYLLFLNLFIAFEAKLLTNPGKLSLTKVIAKSDITFLPKLCNIFEEINLIESR